MIRSNPAKAVCYALTLLSIGASAEVVARHVQGLEALTTRDGTPNLDDFSWVKNWAAVGDSFTAGIGSGRVLDKPADVKCSRYDYSYPSIMNRFFGSSVSSFTYTACSGDNSLDVYDQINSLPSGQDLVVLTAGGNDLCLTSIIKKCILDSFTSDSQCNDAINTAQGAIDSILGNNVDGLLTALDAKMNKDGIIVYGLYGKYFNADTDACSDQEDWVFPGEAGANSLLLTKDRRAKFNTLVDNANKVLQQAIASADGSSRPRAAKVIAANWDPFLDQVKGHYCEAGSAPNPDDPSNQHLQFFKFDTSKKFIPDQKMMALRSIDANVALSNFSVKVDQWYEDPFMIEALEVRDPRAPSCGKGLFSGLLPDSIGKIFHPNQNGHEMIASFVLNAVRSTRAQQLGLPDPSCKPVDTLTCFQKTQPAGYATAYAMYSATADFCSLAAKDGPKDATNWQFTRIYYHETLDEAEFTVKLSGGASNFDEAACNNAMHDILDGCDGNDPKNPMNWKFGGEKIVGLFTYEILVTSTRALPLIQAPRQVCQGSYHGVYSSYSIKGAGWASWDKGLDTLAPNITDCIGAGGLTSFDMHYYLHGPDKDGLEWEATFSTPIWTQARCFNNNKVQGHAGGPGQGGGGCHGSG